MESNKTKKASSAENARVSGWCHEVEYVIAWEGTHMALPHANAEEPEPLFRINFVNNCVFHATLC